MKVRSGFVSNSSSSSFVILGARLDQSKIDELKKADGYVGDGLYNPCATNLVGFILDSIDDGDVSKGISLSELEEQYKRLRELIGQTADIRLYTITEYN